MEIIAAYGAALLKMGFIPAQAFTKGKACPSIFEYVLLQKVFIKNPILTKFSIFQVYINTNLNISI